MNNTSNANAIQIDGNHYLRGNNHQVWDFWLNFGSVGHVCAAIKYLARWRVKGGLSDMHKARHFVEKILESYEAGVCPPLGKAMRQHMAVSELVAANDVGALEAEAITLLAYWASAQELRQALVVINGIIAAETELADRARRESSICTAEQAMEQNIGSPNANWIA